MMTPGINSHSLGRGPRRAGGMQATPTAAQFDPLLPFEQWTDIGVKMARYANGSIWWLGDWLLFGRYKYGRKYREAVAATGLDYQTLRNYASVARRFPLSRRRDNLTFQHHADICALSDVDQDYWLDMASKHGWSRNELRRRVRASVDPTSRHTAQDLRLSCHPEGIERWRCAAERSAVALDAWIVQTLDDAADHVLGTGTPASRRAGDRQVLQSRLALRRDQQLGASRGRVSG